MVAGKITKISQYAFLSSGPRSLPNTFRLVFPRESKAESLSGTRVVAGEEVILSVYLFLLFN